MPTTDEPTLSMKVVGAEVDSLKPHPRNARRGNLAAIRESLAANGQFRPVLVQKGTNLIIGGNHTWKAAKDLGWKKIKAIFLDVDDKAAIRIMLADNRTNDLATYDTDVLAELLKDLDDPAIGTGYDEEAVSDILAALASDEGPTEALQEAIRPPIELLSGGDTHTIEEAEYEEEKAPELGDDGTTFEQPTEDEEDAPDAFKDALGELQGALNLKVDLDLDGDGYYGIPVLRSDMLVDTLPQPFDTWGGKDATPDDGVTHWLWNYGVASASGLPMDRATVCFYTYDDKFESWWDQPDFYTAKMLNAGVQSAVVPDFSLYSNIAVALHVFNVYRAQWMGRYFQECGLKVIPRLQFNDERSLDFCLTGIPKGCPILMHSAQNLRSRGPGKPLTDSEKDNARLINMALERIQPQSFVIYGGPPAHRLVDSGHIKDTNVGSGGILKLKNYAWQRRGTVFDKKEGLGSRAKSESMRKKAKEGQDAAADTPDDERELDLWDQ